MNEFEIKMSKESVMSENSYLEEHRTHKRHFSIDGSAAEDVACSQWQWNVLNHLGQEFEVVGVAHEVEIVVHRA